MREKNQVQAVLDLPSPSSSTVTAQSEGKGTPVKKVDPTSTASSAKKKGKKVEITQSFSREHYFMADLFLVSLVTGQLLFTPQMENQACGW